jgi:glycosyltransferase involved in cell wall biosynthesis
VQLVELVEKLALDLHARLGGEVAGHLRLDRLAQLLERLQAQRERLEELIQSARGFDARSLAEEAEAMGQRGRRAVEERYNWQYEKTKLIGLYESLLTERAKIATPRFR